MCSLDCAICNEKIEAECGYEVNIELNLFCDIIRELDIYLYQQNINCKGYRTGTEIEKYNYQIHTLHKDHDITLDLIKSTLLCFLNFTRNKYLS